MLGVGLAPLPVSLVFAGIASIVLGGGFFALLFLLLVASYATLFFFVLPSLWLLRRFGVETLFSFAGVCGLATVAPWFALYVLLFPEGTGEYAGAPIEVLTILVVPGLLATVAGGVVYRLCRGPGTDKDLPFH